MCDCFNVCFVTALLFFFDEAKMHSYLIIAIRFLTERQICALNCVLIEL